MKTRVFRCLGLRRLQIAWGRANDICLGIETDDEPHGPPSSASPHDHSAYDDGHRYEAADYWNIRRVIRVLDPGPDDVAYDIGCGKGRFVCLLARRPLRGVVGIELDAALYALARSNAARVRGRRSPIEIRCEDAKRADLSTGTIYFMYNPFGAETMCAVLTNIGDSLRANPRTVRMVYYNAELDDLWRACAWLEPITELKTLTGRRVTFWRSRP